jgi:hypothetical protein
VAWQAGLGRRFTLPEDLPPLRLLLVLDNLAGHKTPGLVLWLCAHGVMPRYTPLGGSWLNMAESIQRILKRRALEGTHLATPREISAAPTPFAWGGKRAARRDRARQRRHALGGSGAQTRRPIRRRSPRAAQWRYACQPTHQLPIGGRGFWRVSAISRSAIRRGAPNHHHAPGLVALASEYRPLGLGITPPLPARSSPGSRPPTAAK